jgi:two-component system sensor histidine kinase UhpB
MQAEVLCPEINRTSDNGISKMIISDQELDKEEKITANSIKIHRNESVPDEILAKKLEAIRDEERSALALEIHDVLGQAFTALKMDMAWVRRKLPDNIDQSVKRKLESMIQYIDENIQVVRDISITSMPFSFEEFDQFIPAIKAFVNAFENRTGICCRHDLDLTDLQLPINKCNILFKILQEAMTNIARHSGATNVSILLGLENETLILKIQDNGRGIPFQKVDSIKSFGLYAMRMRSNLLGGRMEIFHPSEQGTCINLVVPVDKGFFNECPPAWKNCSENRSVQYSKTDMA